MEIDLKGSVERCSFIITKFLLGEANISDLQQVRLALMQVAEHMRPKEEIPLPPAGTVSKKRAKK